MNRSLKTTVILAFALCGYTQVATAESFSGYVVELATGPSATATFQTALVGLSRTPTGNVELYRFTSDPIYYATLRSGRIHQQLLTISYTGGTVTGVHLARP